MARNISWRAWIPVLLTLAGLPACLGAEETPAARPDASDAELPIVGLVYGEFDGTELRFREIGVDEMIAMGAEPRPDGLGVVEAPLVDINSSSCGSACTGTSSVGFTNVAGSRRRIVNGAAFGSDPLWTAADAANCGAPPTTGVCQAVRVRNMFTQQLERVYVELLSLTPTGSTTAVQVYASQPNVGTPDFGLSAPAVTNGLWRYGEIARSTSVAGSPSLYWSFSGSTPTGSDFTFSFVAQVRGLVVAPTRRAAIAGLDSPGAGAYTAQTVVTPTANQNIGISENGRYVVFTTGSTIYRKDLTSGALTTIVTGCSTSSFGQPHVSGDGNVVVYQALGCNPSGEAAGNATRPQVYAYDVGTGTTTLVTRSVVTGSYSGSTGSTAFPRVSSDGTAVVFQSAATDIMTGIPTGRTGCVEVYRYDLATATMSHVSALRDSDIFDPATGFAATCNGTAGLAGETPDVSGNGSLIVFASGLALDPSDGTTGATGKDIYVYDHAATEASGFVTVYRVSLTSGGGSPNAASANPTISSDGAYVAFTTAATNILGASTRTHTYRRSSAEGANSSIQRVTLRVDNGEPTGNSLGFPALSSTGRFVALWHGATDLASVSGRFTYSGSQVYVCDMESPVTSLNRCWVASTAQVDAAASSSFAVFAGSASTAQRIGLAYSSDIDAGYVAYLANSSSGWGALSTSTYQVFVSPASVDPRYQQAATGP